MIQASAVPPVVEDTEHLKLVSVVTERDVRGDSYPARFESSRRKDHPTLFGCCGRSKTVKETRRKLHAHRVMRLPVADKAGVYL